MTEIFLTFLRLGCYAFGGPTAHFGYFHEEFVKRRKWVSEAQYADTVALCQFLPGPSSSQTGFAIGLSRGGIGGAFAAWVGFTLPSAILMILVASGFAFAGDLAGAGWIEGLKLTALAVVANAAWSMATKLCPDRRRAVIALSTFAFLLLARHPGFQVLGILVGAFAGWALYRDEVEPSPSDSANPQNRGKAFGVSLLVCFFALLLGLPLLSAAFPNNNWFAVGEAFYRSGSLVFGGGHVVLPLLEGSTVGKGMLDESTFLAGYGAAQALPGPLFAFSAFLGTSLKSAPNGVLGGVFALLMIYLPSWLLVLGGIPLWDRLRSFVWARAALLGANAAVVGLLLAALYNPIWVSSIKQGHHLAFAVIAFALLKFCSVSPWALVLLGAVGGWFAL